MRLLFLRRFSRMSGGHQKLFDYFRHALAHPALDPYLYLTPDSAPRRGTPWEQIDDARVVRQPSAGEFDALFLGGVDWALLDWPELRPLRDLPAWNLVQHVRHADPLDDRFAFLRRSATRICVSREVYSLIRPLANGPVELIRNGVPLEQFRAGPPEATTRPRPCDVLILGSKRPALGRAIQAALSAQWPSAAAPAQPERSPSTRLIIEPAPRAELAEWMRRSRVFVGLPHESEGFYLPAIEAMAAGCAVVCADAVGNREFCRDGETALMPQAGSLAGHVEAVRRLLGDVALCERLSRQGAAMAERYDLAVERRAFHHLVDRWLDGGAPRGESRRPTIAAAG